MHIKRHTQFLLDKEKGKTDARLRYRIRWDGNILAFSLGVRVDIDKWSLDTQRCKRNTTHGKKKLSAQTINKEIERYENAVLECFTRYEQDGKMPALEDLKRAVSLTLDRGEHTSSEKLSELIPLFIDHQTIHNAWTKGTRQKFNALLNDILGYKEKSRLSDVNKSWLTGFVKYFHTNGLRNTTIEKKLEFLKWLLRWAESEQMQVPNDYLHFKPRLKKTDKKIIFLDWEELIHLYNFEVPSMYTGLERVRDVFCFCCFTSLRYSDVANLKRSSVFDSHIEVVTIKTNDTLSIELNKYSEAILERYKDENFKNDLALPVISNQKMNQALKQLCKLAELNTPITTTYFQGTERIDETYPKYELITTHCARRTFICNALMLGITPEIVMKWTGHSDYKAMKPYIDITDKAKAQSMSLFDKR